MSRYSMSFHGVPGGVLPALAMMDGGLGRPFWKKT